MGLEGKTAVITGAARGIGRATALKLAEDGADIVIADLDDQAGETVRLIQNKEREALFVKTDVSSKTEVQALVDRALDKFGKIDILVNNAGIAQFNMAFEDISETDWDQMLNINLKGVFLFCQAVLPHMKLQGSGKIVNVASIAGQTGGMKSGAHYAASKAGVIALTKSVAKSGAPYKINVNAVAPGLIATEMTRNVGYQADSVPLGWLANPEEVAEVIHFLVADSSRYVTGQTVNIDGGMVMN